MIYNQSIQIVMIELQFTLPSLRDYIQQAEDKSCLRTMTAVGIILNYLKMAPSRYSI